jgi:transcription antitermination factor NusG
MGKRWYAVHTSVAAERRAAGGLVERGFEVYLPTATKWCRHARRKTRVYRPLLVRYLFVALDGDKPDFYGVRSVDGVESVVGICGQPSAIPYEAIEPLRMAEARGDFDLTKEHELVRYSKGARVKIAGGVFTGFFAEFERLVGEKRAKVVLMDLGRVIGGGPIEVDLKHLADAA